MSVCVVELNITGSDDSGVKHTDKGADWSTVQPFLFKTNKIPMFRLIVMSNVLFMLLFLYSVDENRNMTVFAPD